MRVVDLDDLDAVPNQASASERRTLTPVRQETIPGGASGKASSTASFALQIER